VQRFGLPHTAPLFRSVRPEKGYGLPRECGGETHSGTITSCLQLTVYRFPTHLQPAAAVSASRAGVSGEPRRARKRHTIESATGELRTDRAVADLAETEHRVTDPTRTATAPDDVAAAGGSGWLMGRVLGVPVYVAPSFAIVAVLLTVNFAQPVHYDIPEIGNGRFIVSFMFAVLLYASVLIHELGHAVTARRLGLPVRRITLQLLGGVTEMGGQAKSPRREFAIAAAGPVLSLGLGVGAWAAIHLLGATPGWLTGPSAASNANDSVKLRIALELLDALMLSNGLVGIFNLLPGLPLDGGVMLRSALWGLTGRSSTATVAAGWVGRGVAVVVFFLPMLIARADGRSPQLFSVVWGALLAGFIWIGASSAMRGAALREALPKLSVRSLTRRAIGVAGELPLAEALRQAGVAGAHGLVVIDSGGRPVGLVNEAAVAATPEPRRPWVSVSTLARRLEPEMVLGLGLGGEELLRRMEACPATEYLVVEDDGAIYGVLAAQDVRSAVQNA
jgi:Zn-dependent protease